MKFSGVLDTNWEQFFIYLNFNCSILLYPKDQMIYIQNTEISK